MTTKDRILSIRLSNEDLNLLKRALLKRNERIRALYALEPNRMDELPLANDTLSRWVLVVALMRAEEILARE